MNKFFKFITENKFFKYIAGIFALIVSVIISFFMRRNSTKNIIEAGKEIGASEERDKEREEAINTADKQIEKNEEVIKRSREAIKRARELRNEDN